MNTFTGVDVAAKPRWSVALARSVYFPAGAVVNGDEGDVEMADGFAGQIQVHVLPVSVFGKFVRIIPFRPIVERGIERRRFILQISYKVFLLVGDILRLLTAKHIEVE